MNAPFIYLQNNYKSSLNYILDNHKAVHCHSCYATHSVTRLKQRNIIIIIYLNVSEWVASKLKVGDILYVYGSIISLMCILV